MKSRVNPTEPRALAILKWFLILLIVLVLPIAMLTDNAKLFEIGSISVRVFDLAALSIPMLVLLLVYEIVRAVKMSR